MTKTAGIDLDNTSIDELIAESMRFLHVHEPQPVDPTPPKSQKMLLRQRIKRLAREVVDLENEALRHFRPLPHVEAFHACTKPICLLIGSNQSSKSIHAMVEVARAVTGQDPWNKYPKENGRAIIVGFDSDHLADPAYKKLFLPGEFQLIPDEITGKLRAVRPDPLDPTRLDPYDEAYSEKQIDAPPLIPERFVAVQAMEHANKEIPRLTQLKNGWKILWRSSNSRPPRGRQIHIVLLDEDLQKANVWINEMIPRLLKHRGKLIWAATGQEGGPDLVELIDKAQEGSPHIAVFNLLISQNPYISDEGRKFFRETLTSEEEVAVRFYGELANVFRLLYREYEPNGVHGYEPFPIPTGEWARYIIVDPARGKCGTLFMGVDPEERHRWVYDGFVLAQSNALQWAAKVKERQGDMKFEAAVIDLHMGRSHQVGIWDNMTVAGYYWKALQEFGVQVRRQGPLSGFFPGSDDTEARTLALKTWLLLRGSGPFAGTPVIKVARGVIPELDRQIRRAQTDRIRTSARGRQVADDLLDCLEYAAHFSPGYYSPEPLSIDKSDEFAVPSVAEQFREKRRKRQLKEQYRTGVFL